jgi:hypothetical protein
MNAPRTSASNGDGLHSAQQRTDHGLRLFQEVTRQRACEVLFNETGHRRFLIADEVGLGKTRVARGVIRTLHDRRSRRAATVVVYIAANMEIARQNLRILRFTDEPHDLPTRPTLLPLALSAVRASGIHVLGFTPQTSLQVKRGTGVVQERALLLRMLGPIWSARVNWETLELFRVTASAQTFEQKVDEIKPRNIDASIAKRFRRAVASEPELQQTFRTLRRTLVTTGTLNAEQRRHRNALIARLREHLAAASIDGLRASLIILDEFHRFREILDEALQPSTLAHRLIANTPTLLLSATPYRMDAAKHELEAQESLLALLRFLFNDGPEVRQVQGGFAELAFALGTVRTDTAEQREYSLERVRQAKTMLENLLTQVMSRYERPQSDPFDPPLPPLALEPEDVSAYLALQRAVDLAATWTKLHSRATVEFWKSAPYLVNFMRGYRIKQTLAAALSDRRHRRRVAASLASAKNAQLHWRDVEHYRKVVAPNPRLRLLEELALVHGQWRALWVPPTLPPYTPTGPFEEVHRAGATKLLVFSAWRVVPSAVAALVGYEAERRAAGNEANTPDARKRRSSRRLLALRYDERNDRPQGTTTLALVYPSKTLAQAVDPYRVARDRGTTAELTAVLADARATCRGLARDLADLADGSRPDPRWYWAAPMLLDVDGGVNVRALLADARHGLRASWRSQAGDTGLDANLGLARAVLHGTVSLGAQPRDLATVLAHIAVGGPATCALRSLQRLDPAADSSELIAAAARIGWSLRTLFNRPDATAIVRSRRRRQRRTSDDAYWRDVVRYCCQGAVQGVLDEYLALVDEELAQPSESATHRVRRVAEAVTRAIELQSLRIEVDDPKSDQHPFRTRTLSSRFAAAFGAAITEDAASIHPEVVRQTFNSPFWPWVLVTTSVGQEGLDFHRYCHALVHWNVPATPVELEQREGRVQRYKSHAVRRSLARNHGAQALAHPDPWAELVRLGRDGAPADDAGFQPEWIAGGNDAVHLQRYVPVLPFSRDEQRWAAVRRARVYYRLVLGQPHPDELVEVLMENLPEQLAHELADELRLDLRPRPQVPSGSASTINGHTAGRAMRTGSSAS